MRKPNGANPLCSKSRLPTEGTKNRNEGTFTKSALLQNPIFSSFELRKLAIFQPIRFDTPFAAAKETPKRVPKTSTKLPNFKDSKNIPFAKPSVLIPIWLFVEGSADSRKSDTKSQLCSRNTC